MDTIAPLDLAEEWDNVGLLLGDLQDDVDRVQTCLTLTANVAREAIDKQAQMIVSHHPILFRPVQRLTADSSDGRMLLDLIAAGIAVYSPHTGYDSAVAGINQQLAEMFELKQIAPLRPDVEAESGDAAPAIGAGRYGTLGQPTQLSELIQTIKQQLRLDSLQFVGNDQAMVERVGIACGSAAEFLGDAARADCQLFITGEARFHSALEAVSLDMNMVLVGHYASERPAVERLADTISTALPQLTVWPSESESDPIQWA
jgi:dinuclear metal center YbgI/SA1388 family protein